MRSKARPLHFRAAHIDPGHECPMSQNVGLLARHGECTNDDFRLPAVVCEPVAAERWDHEQKAAAASMRRFGTPNGVGASPRTGVGRGLPISRTE